jgi:hypothetical protein
MSDFFRNNVHSNLYTSSVWSVAVLELINFFFYLTLKNNCLFMDSVQEYICYIFFKKKKREEGRHFVMVKDLYVENWINGIDLLKYC